MAQNARRRNHASHTSSEFPSVPPLLPASPRRDPDAIARAAYERYEARGREDGHDLEDWLAAERDADTSSIPEAGGRRHDDDAA